MKKFLALILALCIVFALCACGAETETPAEEPEEATEGKVTIEYWFNVGGALEEAIMEQIADFNASQDEIEVVGVFQGYFNDCVAKTQAAILAGNPPVLTSMERAVTPQFYYAGQTVDLSPYIERDGFDVEQFGEFLNFSKYGDEIVALPVMRSVPVLYYNKDAFIEAGLDPESPPTNWEEMLETIDALTIKNGDEVVRYGFEFPSSDITSLQAYVAQTGATMLNEDMTGIGFDNEKGRMVFDYFYDLKAKDGLKVPPAADSATVCKQDFYNGSVAMIVESNAAMAAILEETEGYFEVGAAFLPAYHNNYAYATGGSNIVMLQGCSEEQQEAAWEFIKYLYEAESGGKFVVSTGYVPLTETIYNSAAVQEVIADNPQFAVPFEASQYIVDPAPCELWAECQQIMVNYTSGLLIEDAYTSDEAVTGIATEVAAVLSELS